MGHLRRRLVCSIIAALFVALLMPAQASDGSFPFDRELMLDAKPMRGSKRIPILQIMENGAASIDLWCQSLRGRANISADAITIVPEDAPPAQCPAERQIGDQELLAALTQVTGWRRSGDVIELLGAKTLRFRLMTN